MALVAGHYRAAFILVVIFIFITRTIPSERKLFFKTFYTQQFTSLDYICCQPQRCLYFDVKYYFIVYLFAFHSKVFPGNTDGNGVVRNYLSRPVQAQYVRFYAVASQGWPCLRVEIFVEN